MTLKETTDIWFASFILLKGYIIADYNTIGRHKGQYKFDITEEDWKALKMDFILSDVKRIEELHKQLKDLLY